MPTGGEVKRATVELIHELGMETVDALVAAIDCSNGANCKAMKDDITRRLI